MYNRNHLLINIAKMYYEQNLTQNEIANELNISRPTISTLLKEARNNGLVKITIEDPNNNIHQLERTIKNKYNLSSIIISPVTGSSSQIKRSIGELAATYIETNLPKINSLGIGWGTTMAEFVYAAKKTNSTQLEIIPLMGGVEISDISFHTNHLVFRLAQKYNAKAGYFYAPAIAEDIKTKQLFLESSIIKKIFKKAKNCDAAIVSLGNPLSSNTYKNWELLSNRDLPELKNKKLAGDILANFFDIDGNIIETNLSNRMIGLDLISLTQIPSVLLLASGIDKANSLKILITKYGFKEIIIDLEIANYLIQN